MANILNRKCLQEPKSQTYPRDKAFYRPHIIIQSAIRQDVYCQIGDKAIIPKESAASLRRWMKQEEQAIDVKMDDQNHLNSITQELRPT